jgi:hypothetical protein
MLFNFNPETVVLYLSIIFGVLSLIVTYLLALKIKIQDKENKTIKYGFGLIPVFLLVFSGAFVYWSSSGMETPFFTFLILLSFYFLFQHKNSQKLNWGLIITLVASTLTRPEGFLFFLFIFSYKIILNKRESADKKYFYGIIRREILYFLIPIILHLVFRMLYYGYPLPNTFYAKTGFSEFYLSRGFKYFYLLLKAYLLYGLVLAAPVLFIKFSGDRHKEFLIFIICIVYIAYTILIGGGVLALHRLYFPILPLIFILFGNFLLKIFLSTRENRAPIRNTIVFLIFAFVFSLGISNYLNEKPFVSFVLSSERGLVYKMKSYAEWLNEKRTESGEMPVTAISTIGTIGYFSDTQIIDLLGLTDEYTAHHPREMEGLTESATSKWKERNYNADYVLSKYPEYIIFPAGAKPSAFPEAALFSNPKFISRYYVQLFYSDKLDQLLPVFTRRDLKNKNYSFRQITSDCEPVFVQHYIKANNAYLDFLKNGLPIYRDKIISECNSVMKLCSAQRSNVDVLLGMMNYSSNNFSESKKFFLDAVKEDKMNSIPYFYLKNIYLMEKDTSSAVKMIRYLKKYSPQAVPYLSDW